MKSVKSKLILFVSGVTVVLFTLQMIFSSYTFYKNSRLEIEEKLKMQAEKECNYLNAIFTSFAELGVNYGAAVESVNHYDEKILFPLLEKSIQREPLLVGAGYWLEPYEYNELQKYYGPYMYKENSEVKLTWDYSSEEEDYFQYDWYKDGFNSNHASVWSEPYADAVTGVAMITITSPIVKNDKTTGVVTLDIGLDELQNYIANLKVGEEGYAFLVTGEGYYLGHKNEEYNLAKKITEESNAQLASLGERILTNNNLTSEAVKMDGEDYFVISNPVGDSGLNMVIVLPFKEAFSDLTKILVRSILIFVLAILLYMAALEQVLSKLIIKPLSNVTKAFERLSNYDLTLHENDELTKHAARKDEIGSITSSFTTMQINFIHLIKNILDTSQQVASSAELLTATSQQSSISADEVAKTIEEIAYGANDQAKETEQGAVNVNVLGELIEKDQKYVADLNTCADEVSKLKEEGLKALTDLVEKNHANTKAAGDIHDIIINTNESAEKIVSASQMLEDILGQTNLLALNAAIEAARAGNAGKGFAVVAEEIRKLAEQSNEFTGEITKVIQELIGKTGHAVNTIQEVSKIVEFQTENVEKTNEKFQGIAVSIEKMKNAIEIVNQSGREMETKKHQIINIIENLSAIAEENAAGTEEATASVEEQAASMEQILKASQALAKLAEEMKHSISKFKL